jgi:adenylate cyclase class 2
MNLKNFEFKAAVKDPGKLEKKLLELNPTFIGEDHQTDTYFKVPEGRLKLREGNIENALIFYNRQNIAGAKTSEIILYKYAGDKSLKEIFLKTMEVMVIVDKKRRIYFIGNVKFHFDSVKNLGSFIEVEAIDEEGNIGIEKLKEQCDWYFSYFGLNPSDFISKSYSDLLI